MKKILFLLVFLPTLVFSQQRVGLWLVPNKTTAFGVIMPAQSYIIEDDSNAIYKLTAKFTAAQKMSDVFTSGNYTVITKDATKAWSVLNFLQKKDSAITAQTFTGKFASPTWVNANYLQKLGSGYIFLSGQEYGPYSKLMINLGVSLTKDDTIVGAGLSIRNTSGHSIVQLGSNHWWYTGTWNRAYAGSMIRLDTRNQDPIPGGHVYPVFQVQTREAGSGSYTVPIQVAPAPDGSLTMSRTGFVTTNAGLSTGAGKMYSPSLTTASSEDSLVGWKRSTGEFIAIPNSVQPTYISTNTITGDYTWSNVIHYGYMLEYVIIYNTSETDTLYLDMGTSAGAGYVFLGAKLPANSYTTIAVGKIFSGESATSLYLNDDAFGGSYWKSSTVNVIIVYRKLD